MIPAAGRRAAGSEPLLTETPGKSSVMPVSRADSLFYTEVPEMKATGMPIERRRLTDQIIDQLLSMLADGKLKPGDKLPPEPELMKQFGVGRSSLREAMGDLSLVGLFNVRPGQGTSVNVSAGEFLEKPLRWGMAMNWRDKLEELVEARIAIEQAIVALAAERATEEDLREIESRLQELKGAKKSGRKAIQADLAFHAALAKASHNSVLTRFLAEIRQPLRRWMEQKANLIWDYDVAFKAHEEILEAIKAQDIKRAQTVLRKHLEIAGGTFKKALLGRQLK